MLKRDGYKFVHGDNDNDSDKDIYCDVLISDTKPLRWICIN